MFHIVVFDKTNEVEVVPSIWIKNGECMWPPNKTDIAKAVKLQECRGDEWKPHKMTTMKLDENFLKLLITLTLEDDDEMESTVKEKKSKKGKYSLPNAPKIVRQHKSPALEPVKQNSPKVHQRGHGAPDCHYDDMEDTLEGTVSRKRKYSLPSAPKIARQHKSPALDPGKQNSPKIHPKDHSTADVHRKDHSTPRVHPKGHSAADLLPKDHSTPDLHRRGHSSPELYPSDDSTPELYPRGHSSPDLYPKGHSTPDLYPRGHSSPELNPRGHSTPDLYPRGHSSPELNPRGHSSPDLYPKGHSTPDLYPRGHSSPELNPRDHSRHIITERCTSRHVSPEIRPLRHASSEIHTSSNTSTEIGRPSHASSEIRRSSHASSEIRRPSHAAPSLVPSKHTEPHQTREQTSNLQTSLLRNILTKQEMMIDQLRIIFKTLQSMKSADESETDLDRNLLSLKDVSSLQDMEEQLHSNPDLRKQLVNTLALKGGVDVHECIWRIMQGLITNSLAQKINMRGINGKIGFQRLRLRDVVIAAVRRNRLTSAATEKDIDSTIKRWLYLAPDRDGGRRERMKRKERQGSTTG
ncbi:serine/arginine repetitive matrix protein 2-like [Sinocyclocheilus grahami]|uniref:serine/arginine repetitive matrix protein 2-like n=1 Tax=Sinocyclocheilus grahami TaxID=75366 RepID=UPI0007ACB6E3|nr:PREDICTED: serine/arginine repetitive matrix protein 2-like [Sinocyclocheilus grahami]